MSSFISKLSRDISLKRRLASGATSYSSDPANDSSHFGKMSSSLSLQHQRKDELSKIPSKFSKYILRGDMKMCSQPASKATKVLHQEMNALPLDVDKTQQWPLNLNQSVRNTLVDLIVPETEVMLGYETDEATAFTQKLERHVFTASTSRDKYAEMFAAELRGLDEIQRSKESSLLEPPQLFEETLLTPSQSRPTSLPVLERYTPVPPPSLHSPSLPPFFAAFTPPDHSPAAATCTPFGGGFAQAIQPMWTQISKKDPPVSVQPKYLQPFRSKLESGRYADPWEFIDEVSAAVDSAKIGLPKRTLVYRYWSEVAEVLEANFKRVMPKLGYCCGTRYKFGILPFRCSGNGCVIKVGDKYFCYKDKMAFCVECFQKVPKLVDINMKEDDDDNRPHYVKKSRFVSLTNNISEPEPFVTCVTCGKKHHVVCVLHFENHSPNGFRCKQCHPIGVTLPRARDLPTTKLSSWIEAHVNRYLTQQNLPLNLHVRVVASTKNFVKVQPELLDAAPEMPACLPYTTKAIFVFNEVDSSDLCIFAFYVQEYSSRCAGPNNRRVYISYVDSVHYYEPKNHRSTVYKEILLGYLGYAKQLGFTCAHFWASPVSMEWPDYIFPGHPSDQNMPRIDRLRKWYKSLSERGEKHGIIMGLKCIVEYANDTGMNDVSQLPYFEGDFFPDALENIVREQREEADANKTAKRSKRRASGNMVDKDVLWGKVKAEMEKHKNVFYVTLLNPENNVEPQEISDPDGLIPCEWMEDRDNFMDYCRKQHYEFSSERRAKYSTVAMVDEILNYLAVTCNICGVRISTWFHCTVCKDFDLCTICHGINGHEHLVEKVVIGEETAAYDAPWNGNGQLIQRSDLKRQQASLSTHALHCDQEPFTRIVSNMRCVAITRHKLRMHKV